MESMSAFRVSTPGIYYHAKEFTMTRSQRNKLVAAHADLILGGDFAIEEYAVHFETQMMHRYQVIIPPVPLAVEHDRPTRCVRLREPGNPPRLPQCRGFQRSYIHGTGADQVGTKVLTWRREV